MTNRGLGAAAVLVSLGGLAELLRFGAVEDGTGGAMLELIRDVVQGGGDLVVRLVLLAVLGFLLVDFKRGLNDIRDAVAVNSLVAHSLSKFLHLRELGRVQELGAEALRIEYDRLRDDLERVERLLSRQAERNGKK